MKSVFLILVLFLCLGLFARKFHVRIRLLLITLIVAMILYITYA